MERPKTKKWRFSKVALRPFPKIDIFLTHRLGTGIWNLAHKSDHLDTAKTSCFVSFYGSPSSIFILHFYFLFWIFFSLLLLSITPESVRWLLKKGRVSEAKRRLAKVAKINGKEMPDEPLALPKQEKLGDFRDLFSSPNMIHRTLGSWFIWWVRENVWKRSVWFP